jgi:hypothetical protein
MIGNHNLYAFQTLFDLHILIENTHIDYKHS